MAERYSLEDHLNYRKEQDELARKKAADSRERLSKAAYLAAGGDPALWAATWGELDKAERQKIVETNARVAREAMAQSSRI